MRLLCFILFATLASLALAENHARTTERGVFFDIVRSKSLTSLGVSLIVSPLGSIGGRTFGRDVTGNWTLSKGYFCRAILEGDRVFPRICQLVQQNGNRLRFIADQGTGDTADLRVR